MAAALARGRSAMVVPSAMSEELVVHDYNARANAKPNQRQVLTGTVLEERERSVQFDMFHLSPMSGCVARGADGRIHADVRLASTIISKLPGERPTKQPEEIRGQRESPHDRINLGILVCCWL